MTETPDFEVKQEEEQRVSEAYFQRVNFTQDELSELLEDLR